jgi:hypothetical protein
LYYNRLRVKALHEIFGRIVIFTAFHIFRFRFLLQISYFYHSLRSKGVNFISKKVDTQENFINNNSEYDVVFNCLGLGAKEFCNDQLVEPIRGQIIRVIYKCLNV